MPPPHGKSGRRVVPFPRARRNPTLPLSSIRAIVRRANSLPARKVRAAICQTVVALDGADPDRRIDAAALRDWVFLAALLVRLLWGIYDLPHPDC